MRVRADLTACFSLRLEDSLRRIVSMLVPGQYYPLFVAGLLGFVLRWTKGAYAVYSVSMR